MEKFPIQLLRSIYGTIESARNNIRQRRKDSPLHCRLREASETLNEMIKLEEKEDHPFWYTLYEGMIGRYVQLRTEYRYQSEINKELRRENRDLKDRYFDAISRLENENNIVDKW